MSDQDLHLLLSVSAAMFVILAAAQIFGRLAPWVGQPVVFGEMAAGVALGPSLFGALAPDVSSELFTSEVRPILFFIAMTGLSLYMFVVGVEHKEPAHKSGHTSMPFVMATAGIAAPVVIGAVAATLVAGDLRPDNIDGTLFAVFVGGALSVTAFPMLARILQQRGMMHTPFGMIATRTAAIDDAFAWCLLAVVGASVGGGPLEGLVRTILPASAFTLAVFCVLPMLFRKPMQAAVREGRIGEGLFGALILLVLGAGWFTDYIGIYSVFGGFIVGMALPRVQGFSSLLSTSVLPTVRSLMLPVFFAFSGLNTDITQLSGHLIPVTLVILVAAFVSKTASSVVVMRAYRCDWRSSAAMGALMNARGLMILIFINIGLGLGVIEQRMYSILVVVALVTTALALPLYRRMYSAAREDEGRAAAAAEAVQAAAGGARTSSRTKATAGDSITPPR
ncbi:MAG: cation:proton antiporter [Brachybacterium sp.]|nr:cation:proton antiporter [Brachybacterium sp.]